MPLHVVCSMLPLLATSNWIRAVRPLTVLEKLWRMEPSTDSASKYAPDAAPLSPDGGDVPGTGVAVESPGPQAPLALRVSATRPPKSGSSTPSRKERWPTAAAAAVLGLQQKRDIVMQEKRTGVRQALQSWQSDYSTSSKVKHENTLFLHPACQATRPPKSALGSTRRAAAAVLGLCGEVLNAIHERGLFPKCGSKAGWDF